VDTVVSIFKNRDKTKPEHDTMRQISRSEMPSGLDEALKYIARAHQPKVIEWHHLCPCAGMVNTVLQDGQICPDCFVDQDGVHHGRGGAA